MQGPDRSERRALVAGGGNRRCGVPPSAAKTIDVQPMPDGGVAAGAWPVPGVASGSFAITEAAEEHPMPKEETALRGDAAGLWRPRRAGTAAPL